MNEFWIGRTDRFCHIPVKIGRDNQSHLTAVSVSKEQRKIFYYDSKKQYGPLSCYQNDKVFELGEQSFKKSVLQTNEGKALGISSSKEIK